MKLSEKQIKFTEMVGKLITYAYANGYGLTVGDAYRDPRVHGVQGDKASYSAARSAHKSRLAIDFNLFINGEYITDGNKYIKLGEYWESLGGAWGGRFGDGNHFSLEHNGIK